MKVDMEMEVGSMYEINHSMLPPKAPIQLRNLRVLMVSSRTEHKVFGTYPSNLSLQAFFNDEDGRSTRSNGLLQPDFDEKYVMGLNLAGRVLCRQIPFEEYAARRGTLSFWALPETEPKKYNGCEVKSGGCHDKASCLDGQREGAVICLKWDMRKKNRFICQNIEVVDDVNGEREVQRGKGMEEVKVNEEGEFAVKKRRDCFRGAEPGKKKMKLSRNVSSADLSKLTKKSRWSEKRYTTAASCILKVMKAKNAVYGNPILRPDLRTESRKLVGDTGLIDHILKHMAEEVAPGGKERFRRRHNPEGHMEYWLESADLADIRREAGIIDPYWKPPPGWKPGDCLTLAYHHGCAGEIEKVKEQMRNIKREIEVFGSRGQEDDQALVSLQQTTCLGNQEVDFSSLKALYAELLKRKADVDEQLLAILSHMQELEVDTVRLLQAMKENDKNTSAIIVTNEDSPTDKVERQITPAIVSAAIERAEKIQRLKSGFRLCKPEGTFLWPGMASTPTSTFLLLGDHPENLLLATTPSSACSSTRCSSSSQADLHQQLQGGQRLPVKPTAKKLATLLPEVKDDTPSPTGSNTFKTLDLDLNQVPKDVPITDVGMLSSPNAEAYATATASSIIPPTTQCLNQLHSFPVKRKDCYLSVRELDKQVPTSDINMLPPQPQTSPIEDHTPLLPPPPAQFVNGKYVYMRRMLGLKDGRQLEISKIRY